MTTPSADGTRAVQRRVKTGCLTCRKRHMKCDERKPRCRHCEIAGRTCAFPPPAGPAGLSGADPDDTTFDFPPDHVWLETPPLLRFVYQVNYVQEEEEDEGSESLDDTQTTDKTICGSSSLLTPINDTAIAVIGEGSPNSHAAPSMTPHVALQPVTYFTPGAASECQLEVTSIAADSPAISLNSNLSIYIPRPRAPLEDPQRARLMRHYVDNLSGWLDLNDPRHHFSIAVPHLAMTCPMLLDAILAFSARDLSRVDASVSPLVADEYHDSCVHRLIPALQDLSLAAESALPLSTVILRMHEMLGSRGGEAADFQRHLRGCISLFRYNRNRFRPGSLQHAAFWTYVRQEILTALATPGVSNVGSSVSEGGGTGGTGGGGAGSPTNIDTVSDRTYRVVFSGETDDDWTNNITWLTARVINHCFGPALPPAEALERWEELRRDVDSWRERLPDTFRPLSVVLDDKPFPIITYLCTWHVIGMQFYHLCRVLLALHYPLQASGINLLRFMRYIETEIAEHTSQLCGIVRGLTAAPSCRYPGTLVNATEPLVACGRTLKARPEQLAVLRMLRQIEAATGWPVDRAVRCLEEEWDGQMSL